MDREDAKRLSCGISRIPGKRPRDSAACRSVRTVGWKHYESKAFDNLDLLPLLPILVTEHPRILVMMADHPPVAHVSRGLCTILWLSGTKYMYRP